MVTRRDPARRVLAASLRLLVALCFTSCDSDEPATPTGPVPVEVQTAREIAAALFADGDRMAETRAALEPLLQRRPPAAEDLLRVAAVELELDHLEQAAAMLQQAGRAGEKSARFHYLVGLHAYRSNDLAKAQSEFEQVMKLAPEDLPTLLMVAVCRMDQGAANAAETLRRVQAMGPERAGSWYTTALYRLQRISLQAGAADEALKLRQEYSELQARGLLAATIEEMERGTFGNLEFPPQSARAPAPPADPIAWQAPRVLAPELAGMTQLRALDLKDDGKVERNADREAVGWTIGRVDLLAFGPAGIVAVRQESGDGAPWPPWVVQPLWSQPVSALASFDFGQDGDLDFWIVTESGLELLVGDEGKLAASTLALPPLAAPPSEFAVVDFDHEGDLDLLLVGPFGVRLWRDDGAARGGSFTDVTAEAGLAGSAGIKGGAKALQGPIDWCVVEDLDGDQDVDLLVGGANGVVVADNLRGGRFEVRGDRTPATATPQRKPIVADLDGDGRPEIWFGSAEQGVPIDGRTATTCDLNGDGALDLLRGGDPAFTALLSIGSPVQKSVELVIGVAGAGAPASMKSSSAAPPTLVPLAPDAPPALAWLSSRGLELALPAPSDRSDRSGLRLSLLGRKDNRRGVGAIVEVRAGASYRRLYWPGEPQWIGIGIGLAGAHVADWVRVTWPNGVIQSEMGIGAGRDRILEQKEGLIGSCPFLYAWNGTTYGFITDVLGTTPLGLPMRPGELVPPDHDEYVLIRGDQLVARDGMLEVQITEELREVTYLDHARLLAVDHPSEAETLPNERFTLPSFPEPHIHAVVAPLAPMRARDGDGGDWTDALRAIDFRFAAPFTPYAGPEAGGAASSGQFLGLAPLHHLEIEFDRNAIPRSGRLRLLLTGWFFWTDASVNVASSRTPDVRFVPPLLEVPDGEGGWRSSGPPIGFPAGKQKTMVIDVGELLVRDDPRLRLTSTLRLYWDCIRLAVDADDDGDAPVRVTTLAAASAELWSRGFSEPRELAGGHGLEWFDWDLLSHAPRWNQHPGFYTRYGAVRELLDASDDRFVVMGSGDALSLRFLAGELPPLPEGWSRDWLLYLDGWAKDRDPNTVAALFVEPLPFHGMSGYPYGADERFPDDLAHRQWLLEWQTRPATRTLSERTSPR